MPICQTGFEVAFAYGIAAIMAANNVADARRTRLSVCSFTSLPFFRGINVTNLLLYLQIGEEGAQSPFSPENPAFLKIDL